jgi:hypothetical protein
MASYNKLIVSLKDMLFSFLLAVLFTGSVKAANQDLLSALSAQNSVSKFTSLLNNYTSLVTAANAGNKTGMPRSFRGQFENCTDQCRFNLVIAPSDAAFDTFFSSVTSATNYSTSGQLEALLSYHILEGVLPHTAITSTPQFFTTLLQNSKYTNVTTGQVVKTVLNGTVAGFESAVNHVSNIIGPNNDIIFLGGLVHVVDGVLVSLSQPFSRKFRMALGESNREAIDNQLLYYRLPHLASSRQQPMHPFPTSYSSSVSP